MKRVASAFIVLAACSSNEIAPTPDADTPVDASIPDQGTDASQGVDVGKDTAPDALGPCDGNPASAKDGTFTTKDGVGVLVRVPKTGFDPKVPHPLIVVYSVGGGTAAGTETGTGLTPDATARGYIIGYVDDVPPTSPAEIQKAVAVAPAITTRWCVDPLRIYMTGCSNGGSISLVNSATTYQKLAASAPVSAGAKASVMQVIGCPAKPISVMIIHSIDDMLFPIDAGYGADVATFWATCNACNPTPGAPLSNGCVAYTGCASGVEVQYCQQTGPHGTWFNLNTSILDFFDRFVAPP